MPRPVLALLTTTLAPVATISSAQTSVFSTLSGRVADATGAVVPGATVTLTNLDTDAATDTVTSGDGNYQFPRLRPGHYRLEVELSGFKRVARQLAIAVNDQPVLDVTLTPGDLAESVTVVGDQLLVQARTTDVSGVVDQRRVSELPLNGRNFARLTLIAPGVGGGDLSNPSVSGGRGSTNSYVIDGVGASDERFSGGITLGGGAAGSSFGAAGGNIVSTEAIQEFRVITSNPDATVWPGQRCADQRRDQVGHEHGARVVVRLLP